MLSQVVMLSLWRNDEERRIGERMRHLTSKTYPALRWIWVCGDSDDATGEILREYAAEMQYEDKDIAVIEHHTPWTHGAGMAHRLKRISASVTEGLHTVRKSDEYVIVHESDLVSPPDLVERFLLTGKCPIAAVTWLPQEGGSRYFYDIWAFERHGARFANVPPYHACWKPDQLFEVDSVGSCWMMPAQPIRDYGICCHIEATREICKKLRRRGHTFWVDPTIEVIQPRDLWVPWVDDR